MEDYPAKECNWDKNIQNLSILYWFGENRSVSEASKERRREVL